METTEVQLVPSIKLEDIQFTDKIIEQITILENENSQLKFMLSGISPITLREVPQHGVCMDVDETVHRNDSDNRRPKSVEELIQFVHRELDKSNSLIIDQVQHLPLNVIEYRNTLDMTHLMGSIGYAAPILDSLSVAYILPYEHAFNMLKETMKDIHENNIRKKGELETIQHVLVCAPNLWVQHFIQVLSEKYTNLSNAHVPMRTRGVFYNRISAPNTNNVCITSYAPDLPYHISRFCYLFSQIMCTIEQEREDRGLFSDTAIFIHIVVMSMGYTYYVDFLNNYYKFLKVNRNIMGKHIRKLVTQMITDHHGVDGEVSVHKSRPHHLYISQKKKDSTGLEKEVVTDLPESFLQIIRNFGFNHKEEIDVLDSTHLASSTYNISFLTSPIGRLLCSDKYALEELQQYLHKDSRAYAIPLGSLCMYAATYNRMYHVHDLYIRVLSVALTIFLNNNLSSDTNLENRLKDVCEYYYTKTVVLSRGSVYYNETFSTFSGTFWETSISYPDGRHDCGERDIPSLLNDRKRKEECQTLNDVANLFRVYSEHIDKEFNYKGLKTQTEINNQEIRRVSNVKLKIMYFFNLHSIKNVVASYVNKAVYAVSCIAIDQELAKIRRYYKEKAHMLATDKVSYVYDVDKNTWDLFPTLPVMYSVYTRSMLSQPRPRYENFMGDILALHPQPGAMN